MDGKTVRPSPSGMTMASPLSTVATTLLLVPRSIPTTGLLMGGRLAGGTRPAACRVPDRKPWHGTVVQGKPTFRSGHPRPGDRIVHAATMVSPSEVAGAHAARYRTSPAMSAPHVDRVRPSPRTHPEHRMEILKSVVVFLMLAAGFGLAGHTVFWLLRYIAIGRTDDRTRIDELSDRVFGFFKYVLGQARVIREFGGLLHFFIFWGFLVLQAETIEYFIRGFVDDFRFGQLIGHNPYHMLLLLQDVFGLLVLIAIVIAAVRRFVIKPDHVPQSMDAAVILALIGGLMLTKFLAHGAEIAYLPAGFGEGELGWDATFTPIALATSYLVASGPESALDSTWLGPFYGVNYFAHIAIVVFFANYIPRGKHLHLIGAMPNVFFRKLEPGGSLYPIDLEDEDAESFGAGTLEDLTWKQLLDTYACTECGRCEHYCPAFNTGKELNPMMIIHKLKDHIKDKGIKVYREKGEDDFPTLAGGVISAEELMACTTCGACVSNCPVFIEHVDTIVDMRRYLILTEGEMDPEVSRTFRNIENSSNPWGVSNSTRGDWAEGLDIPLVSELDAPPEYLFFVGCAGSFDDRAKKVTIATARILKAAGVNFAILGPEEACTGDPARRIGNEYLYYMQASQNVETLNGHGITKIITTCPHCFHTVGKEYPQLGGNYEVLHHTKVLNDLLREKRVQVRSKPQKVTYHDSCYIGRWNDDYSNPRETLAQLPGTSVTEMSWNKRQGLCCGAGGGRFWMEEHHGKRVNVHRTDMALETGAERVVVNCPFCMTMLTDGLGHRDATMDAIDLAELVAENLVESSPDAATDPAE
ncbi:MAG: (Fe-S)-binding protein [Deltaproteobacteria bacterium]|nr:MAG: (Fe-S)-binding protein [Deltaproteobacteria bacterium]